MFQLPSPLGTLQSGPIGNLLSDPMGTLLTASLVVYAYKS